MTSVDMVDSVKPGFIVVRITDLRKCLRIAGTVWDSLVNDGWEGVMNESGWYTRARVSAYLVFDA